MLRDGPMIDAHRVTLAAPDDFDGWRDAARDLAEAGVPAERGRCGRSPAASPTCSASERRAARMRRQLRRPARRSSTLPQSAICHSRPRAVRLALRDAAASCAPTAMRWTTAPTRWSDRLAAAGQGGAPRHPQDARLRPLPRGRGRRGTRFVAWFEPEHHIVRARRRLLRPPLRQHALVDPDARAVSIHWDGEQLSEGPGAIRARRAGRRPAGGDVEDLLRLDLQSGAAEGRRDAQGDAEEILEKHARDGVGRAVDRGRAGAGERDDRHFAAGHAPSRRQSRRRHGRRCATRPRAAPAAISTNARTQTVFGEGPLDATIVFVGEQPGDQEDLAGRPFVGPAGQLFDARAGRGRDRPRARPTSPTRSSISSSIAARQAPHPQEARCRRDRRLPLVARPGTRADPAAGDRRAGRDRRARR